MTLIIKTTGWEDYLGDQGAYIKALLMGPPGAGKTRSASFWPRPIFADCEKGRMSIADRGVPYAEIRSSEQMDQLLDLVKNECKKGAKRQFDTLVIDTLDSYQRTIIAERLEKEKKEALSGWADWGHLDGKMTQFVEKLLNLPMNIVVNLHVKETTEGDDQTSQIVMAPKLKGDLRDQIAAEFDLVGFMGTYWAAEAGERTLKRAVRWTPEPKYPILKDRSGRLPQFTEVDFTDEDFYRIYNALVGDFVDQMPAATVLTEVESPAEAHEPVGPDEKGGPIATVKDFPRRKSDKKDKPEPEPKPDPVQAPVEVDATPVPAKEPDVAPPEAALTDVSTTELAAAVVGTPVPSTEEEVISSPAEADEPKREAPKCGDQPESRRGVADAVTGCGKNLEDEPRDRVNIALLRTNTFLCNECFQTWKNAN